MIAVERNEREFVLVSVARLDIVVRNRGSLLLSVGSWKQQCVGGFVFTIARARLATGERWLRPRGARSLGSTPIRFSLNRATCLPLFRSRAT